MVYYITYYSSGSLRKGVVNETIYRELQRNSSVSNLTVHPNHRTMDMAFNEATGKKNDLRNILHG